ncbi:hypothetical protein GGR04_001779 [Aureimonas pseudogalii]|uniref:Uncharacterized protein n=1 Tax=Aureimonas pseudogalii TaxID=1744844 RepID=A0A7W6EAW1_9HYPH|nr:hypothetical protein [Aureimonas pseudogalii]
MTRSTLMTVAALVFALTGCQLERQRGVLPTGTGQTSSGGLVPGQVEH